MASLACIVSYQQPASSGTAKAWRKPKDWHAATKIEKARMDRIIQPKASHSQKKTTPVWPTIA